MTLPAIPTDLTPATADEISDALKAMFSQFPSHDSGDPRYRVLGYQDALSDEPLWAVERAVRRFLRGEVSSHDGRFLPTSAELARVVREESSYAKRIAERKALPVMLDDKGDREVVAAQREANYRRLKGLAEMLGPERVADPEKLEPVSLDPDKGELVGRELVEALERRKGQAA